MRINLKKYIFIGPGAIKDRFYEQAQKVGVIDFIEKTKRGSTISDEMASTIDAIKVLRRFPPLEQFEGIELEEASNKVTQINHLWDQLESSQGDLSDLMRLQEEIAPFGHFSLEKIKQIESDGSKVVQFFSTRRGLAKEDMPNEGMMRVRESDELDYYISIQNERINYPKLAEVQIKDSLSEVEKKIAKIQNRIEETEDQLKALVPYHESLHDLFLAQVNTESLVIAKEKSDAYFDAKVFVSTGFVPEDELQVMKDLCQKSEIFFEEVKIEESDKVPTCLKNKGLPRVGEDLIHVYDTPSPNDQDPSLWVLAFFTLFFSLIIGDAGYGLVFLSIALFFWFKYPQINGIKQRFLKLFTLLSTGCIIWGILANNYFGIQLSPENPLRKVSLINWMVEQKAVYHIGQKDAIYQNWVTKFPKIAETNDPHEFIKGAVNVDKEKATYVVLNKFTDQVLLELALLIGSVHICLSMGRYFLRHLALGGWILFIIGSYLFIPYHLSYTSVVQYIFGISKATAGTVGKDLMIIGLVFACVLSLIQIKMKGLLEIAVVIQIVSDILSYLRIYALGLAGGIMAATINEMTLGLPIVIGVIVMLFAHIFNMMLGIMGGVIHGLRLNFLEWYHYSFEGGGKEFKPLRIQKKDE